ncbi:glycosyltransferase family protein [Helicobacter cynogastricus]|uniref:glycosyltransferase family protein n=1 Tax=Helicobacter cynogastricus TaxID=329937 RepID=UPI001F30B25A|nr:glycosyltransferase [Helicobacter cynogastricus]
MATALKMRGGEGGERLPLEETNAFFNACELVLGCGNMLNDCLEPVNMKLRDFDAPMSGAAYITTYNPDLENLFAPNSMIFYRSIPELIEKVRHYLTHKKLLIPIRTQAFQQASSKHTYERRLSDVFKKLEIS